MRREGVLPKLCATITRHEHPSASGIRTTFLGVFVNTLLAATKGIAGVLGNSYALIADAIESVTDIATSLIVWDGLKISRIIRQ
jgi:divalent metal cation (Fe/Co/Zn/Cd) transporter